MLKVSLDGRRETGRGSVAARHSTPLREEVGERAGEKGEGVGRGTVTSCKKREICPRYSETSDGRGVSSPRTTRRNDGGGRTVDVERNNGRKTARRRRNGCDKDEQRRGARKKISERV